MQIAPITVQVHLEPASPDAARMDRGGTLTELAAPESGYLFEGRVARVHAPGDGLRYAWGEEHRDSAELDRVVAQLAGKPVAAPPDAAFGHPVDLIKAGAPHKVVGRILAARRDGDHAVAWIFITDAETIKAIREDGVDELSLGYGCRADAGGNQHDTYVDHLSVVPRARCGATCALRADGADEQPTEEHMRTDHGACGCQANKDNHMDVPGTVAAPPASESPCACKSHAVNTPGERMADTEAPKMDEFQKKIAELTADAAAHKVRADQEKARADEATKAKADAEKRAETLEGERDAARTDAAAQKSRADSAIAERDAAKEQARKDADERLDAQVTEKVALLTTANEVLGSKDAEGKTIDRSKMSAREIKLAIIKHVDGVEVDEKKSDDYVQARYDGALTRANEANDSHAAVRAVTQQSRQVAATRKDDDDEEASIRAMHANYRKPAGKKA